MSFTREKAREIAARLNCDAATVLAVAEIESGGRHDLPDGRPQILFEAHWFSKLTGHQYDESHPNISSREWNRSLYKGGAAEWGRLNAAIQLDAEAALKSASWGLFQIMGFNHKAAGFETVVDFVNFIKGPDDADMEAFVNFVKANPLVLKAMQEKDWKSFARFYNGPGAVASYSAKMADAYAKHAGRPDREETGPPLPMSDPTMKPRSTATSKTVITTAAAGAATVASVADQAAPALEAINQATTVISGARTTWDGVKDAIGPLLSSPILPVVLGVIVIGLLLFVGIRYVLKARRGDVVVT